MNNFFDNDTKTALQAQFQAQQIAFAPVIFQIARSMRDLGVLKALYENKQGMNIDALGSDLHLSHYSLKVLLESSLSADIVKKDENRYIITKTGEFLLNDTMTNINMDFNHYVNYLGLYDLDEALKSGKPKGLKRLNVEGDTIYPALSNLPPKIQKSWFDFDHFYSDNGFPTAIRTILKYKPKKILDIGGNTGKFAKAIIDSSEDTNVTIMDLPQQIKLARENIKGSKYENGIEFIAQNILEHDLKIPQGFDVIWVSQFLDCFDEENIIKLLSRIKDSMNKNCRLIIMEPLWDKQLYETSAFCIINTSPYFSAIANGQSKMFNFEDLENYINKAGLQIEKEIHNIGIWQSICVCK